MPVIPLVAAGVRVRLVWQPGIAALRALPDLLVALVAPDSAQDAAVDRAEVSADNVTTSDGIVEGVDVSDGTTVVRVRPEHALAEVLSTVNRIVLEATPTLALHAGVVAVDGSVVAFPGASGLGKSTLTAALLHLGAGYVSDEALCLDRATSTVVPYPRPLGLSAYAYSVLTGRPVEPGPGTAEEQEVFVSVPGAPNQEMRVTTIALLERRHDKHSRAVLTVASQGEGLTALARRSFNGWRDPVEAFEILAPLVRSTRVVRIAYDDPLECAEELLRYQAGSAPT